MNKIQKEQLKKVKNKRGATGIVITLCIVIVVCMAIVPGEISNTITHITSKKLKTHINAIANSDCLIIPTVNEDGNYIEEYEKGAESTKIFFEKLFKCSLVENAKETNSDKYSISYTNSNNSIAIQYDFYFKTDVKTSKPTTIMDTISTNSKGEIVDTTDIINSVSSKKSMVIITVRYDFKNFLGQTKSMIRYGSSQINILE